ncbi:unnamed protein product [Moneuplotes crassus]|uniref:Uncharacterized protein n=1 Tax=Euplotes crassus TaxID=5936 RepID=A0AAD1Y7J3_EUPCR|nr:unnamed protein product [Moneuplotes crassus]
MSHKVRTTRVHVMYKVTFNIITLFSLLSYSSNRLSSVSLCSCFHNYSSLFSPGSSCRGTSLLGEGLTSDASRQIASALQETLAILKCMASWRFLFYSSILIENFVSSSDDII